MPRVAIVTDSTVDFPPALQVGSDVAVVPLVVSIDGETFHDKVDLTSRQLYERLAASSGTPKTAAPSLGAFTSTFQSLLGTHDAIVAIHIPRSLSTTCDVARRAAEEVDPARITIVDSGTTTMAMGWLVDEALRLAQAGAAVPDIVASIEGLRARCRIYAVVDTLDFLQRGGRIGRAQAFVGSLLNVKPILEVREGEVYPRERVRTLPAALRRVADLVVSAGPVQRVAVMHGAAPAAAEALHGLVQEKIPHTTVERGEIGAVLGVHAGPGVVGSAVLLAS